MNRLIFFLLFLLPVFQFSPVNAKSSKGLTNTLYANKLSLNPFSPEAELALAESEKLKSYTDKLDVTTTEISVSWPEEFSHDNYFLFVRAWTEQTIDGKTVQIQNGVYDFVKSVSGFSLKLQKPQGYLSYYAVDTINFDPEVLVEWSDTLATIATKNDLNQFWSKAEITPADTARWGNSGPDEAVESVNGQTGTVNIGLDDVLQENNTASSKSIRLNSGQILISDNGETEPIGYAKAKLGLRSDTDTLIAMTRSGIASYLHRISAIDRAYEIYDTDYDHYVARFKRNGGDMEVYGKVSAATATDPTHLLQLQQIQNGTLEADFAKIDLNGVDINDGGLDNVIYQDDKKIFKDRGFPANVDADTVMIPGAYRVSAGNWVGLPIDNDGVLLVYNTLLNSAIVQEYNDYYGFYLYRRNNWYGTWGPWRKIYHSYNSNLPTVDWVAKNLKANNLHKTGTDSLQIGNTNGGLINIGGNSGISYIGAYNNILQLKTSRDGDDVIISTGDTETARARFHGTGEIEMFTAPTHPAGNLPTHSANLNDLTSGTRAANFLSAQVGGADVLTAGNDPFSAWDKDYNDLSNKPTTFTPSTLFDDYGFIDNSANWDTAYSWGNHANMGYLTSNSLLDTTRFVPNTFDAFCSFCTDNDLDYRLIATIDMPSNDDFTCSFLYSNTFYANQYACAAIVTISASTRGSRKVDISANGVFKKYKLYHYFDAATNQIRLWAYRETGNSFGYTRMTLLQCSDKDIFSFDTTSIPVSSTADVLTEVSVNYNSTNSNLNTVNWTVKDGTDPNHAIALQQIQNGTQDINVAQVSVNGVDIDDKYVRKNTSDEIASFDGDYLTFKYGDANNVDYISFNDGTNAYYFNADRQKTGTSANANVFAGKMGIGTSSASKKLEIYTGNQANANDGIILKRGSDQSLFGFKHKSDASGVYRGAITFDALEAMSFLNTGDVDVNYNLDVAGTGTFRKTIVGRNVITFAVKDGNNTSFMDYDFPELTSASGLFRFGRNMNTSGSLFTLFYDNTLATVKIDHKTGSIQHADGTADDHSATVGQIKNGTLDANFLSAQVGGADVLTVSNDPFTLWDKDYNDLSNKPDLSYLPLAGGTLTGNVELYGLDPVLKLQQNTSVPGNPQLQINAAGVSNSASIKINSTYLWTTTNKARLLRIGSAVGTPVFDLDVDLKRILVDGHTVYHEGNFSPASKSDTNHVHNNYIEIGNDPFSAWDKDYNDLSNKPDLSYLPLGGGTLTGNVELSGSNKYLTFDAPHGSFIGTYGLRNDWLTIAAPKIRIVSPSDLSTDLIKILPSDIQIGGNSVLTVGNDPFTLWDKDYNDLTNKPVIAKDTLYTTIALSDEDSDLDNRTRTIPFPINATINEVFFMLNTASAGSISVALKKNGTTQQTFTISSGQTSVDFTGLAHQFSKHDRLTLDVTATGGTGLKAIIYYE